MQIGLRGLPLAGLLLCSCASSSSDITPQYISPLQYQNYSCVQLAEEARSVSSRAAQVSGVQDGKRTNDAVATTVGVVIFWPALLMMKGDGATAGELARLKGELEAVERMSIQKKCGIEFRKETLQTN
ncbi:MAG TPA: hypothetical protein VNQ56_05035 [Pseudolabrys sp.]|nr:hypothetical protein [Pseudolabrys sp.]